MDLFEPAPKRPKTRRPFDLEKFNTTIHWLNKCTQGWYNEVFPKQAKLLHLPCCSPEEEALLKECIGILEDNVPAKQDDIYTAIIGYYYMSIVNEYHVADYNEYPCYDGYTDSDGYFHPGLLRPGGGGKKLIKVITTSDAPWASILRRKLNNLDGPPMKGGVGALLRARLMRKVARGVYGKFKQSRRRRRHHHRTHKKQRKLSRRRA